MTNFLAWLNTWYTSHKLSAHITFAGLVSVFGTLFGLYNENPAVRAAFQKLNSELPGWAEAIATIAVAFLMLYAKTSKPAQVYSSATGTIASIPAGQTVFVPSVSGTAPTNTITASNAPMMTKGPQ